MLSYDSAARLLERVFKSKTRVPTIVAIALLLLAGCGGHDLETARVTGTITLDGKPLPHGTITFTPKKGRSAIGTIQADGSFTLSTYEKVKGDGAIIGMHRVAVICEEEVAQEKSPSQGLDANLLPRATRSLIPKIYSGHATSGLTFEVKSGEANVANFQLSGKPSR